MTTSYRKQMAKIKKGSAISISTQVKKDLKRKILSGKFPPDTKIPSERNLADFYKVSRMSVRHAIIELNNEGYVCRSSVKGTFVKKREPVEKNKNYSRKCLGLVVCPIFRADFPSKVILGIEKSASENGYSLILRCCNEDSYIEKRELLEMTQDNIHGVIVISGRCSLSNIPVFLKVSQKIPLVVVDRFLGEIGVDYVSSDDENGAFLAVTHLIDLGHRKILHLAGPKNYSTAENRRKGYEKALASRGIKFDPELVRITDWHQETSYYETKKFLLNGNRVTAVFACNDQAAIGAYNAFKEAGLRIPEDISIVGYGNLHFENLPATPLTTVDQHLNEMGREAFRLILEKLQRKRPLHETKKIIVPVELIVRKSCGIMMPSPLINAAVKSKKEVMKVKGKLIKQLVRSV